MTQEEKQLLLKDICSRLPYGVKMSNINAIHNGLDLPPFTIDISDYKTSNPLIIINSWYLPWLRPMSSMTEEEKKQFFKLKQMSVTVIVPNANRLEVEYIVDLEDDGDGLNHLYDWLNAHHFDYRGLIEKGLALKAPEDMYKTN